MKTRVFTLDEFKDRAGESILLLNGTYWHDADYRKAGAEQLEIWSLINLTDDTHPIHLHLVRFQILDRQPFDTWTYQTRKELEFAGPPDPPAPGEAGWKDTVRAAGGW